MPSDVAIMSIAFAFGDAFGVRTAIRAHRRNDWKAVAVSCIAAWAGFLLAFALETYDLVTLPYTFTFGALFFTGMALWEEFSPRTWTPVANGILRFIELSSNAFFMFLLISGYMAVVRGCF